MATITTRPVICSPCVPSHGILSAVKDRLITSTGGTLKRNSFRYRSYVCSRFLPSHRKILTYSKAVSYRCVRENKIRLNLSSPFFYEKRIWKVRSILGPRGRYRPLLLRRVDYSNLIVEGLRDICKGYQK